MSLMDKHNTSILTEPFGLVNIGNNCYFNSLIQSLFSCSSLLKKNYRFLRDIPKKQSTREFLELIIQNYKKKNPKMRLKLNAQEDGTEALYILLDMLPEEAQNLFSHRYRTYMYCECGHLYNQTVENELIFIMYGNNIAELYGEEIMIPNFKMDKKCVCGKQICNLRKIRKLKKVSEIIVIFMAKKYRHKTLIKTDDVISFQGKDGKISYKKIAQIDHFGSLSGGHYISYAQRKDGFYKFNDSHVEKIKGFTNNLNTYILFYHLV